MWLAGGNMNFPQNPQLQGCAEPASLLLSGSRSEAPDGSRVRGVGNGRRNGLELDSWSIEDVEAQSKCLTAA